MAALHSLSFLQPRLQPRRGPGQAHLGLPGKAGCRSTSSPAAPWVVAGSPECGKATLFVSLSFGLSVFPRDSSPACGALPSTTTCLSLTPTSSLNSSVLGVHLWFWHSCSWGHLLTPGTTFLSRTSGPPRVRLSPFREPLWALRDPLANMLTYLFPLSCHPQGPGLGPCTWSTLTWSSLL